MIGFSFTSDWLREWREFSGPITGRSRAKLKVISDQFDTQLKITAFSYFVLTVNQNS